ncbi:MAG: hypothetical protein AAF928_21030 [Myxococcota bacterium]
MRKEDRRAERRREGGAARVGVSLGALVFVGLACGPRAQPPAAPAAQDNPQIVRPPGAAPERAPDGEDPTEVLRPGAAAPPPPPRPYPSPTPFPGSGPALAPTVEPRVFARPEDAERAVDDDEEEVLQALRDDGARDVGAGACLRACRALDSMRRSVEGLCALTGDGDRRCAAGRARFERASNSVRDAGCRCGSE